MFVCACVSRRGVLWTAAAHRQAGASTERCSSGMDRNEADELDRVREYASQLHADSYAVRARETPCGAEREACRLCYETNKRDTLRCGNEVAAYDACAREAQRRFVEGVGVGGADE